MREFAFAIGHIERTWEGESEFRCSKCGETVYLCPEIGEEVRATNPSLTVSCYDCWDGEGEVLNDPT